MLQKRKPARVRENVAGVKDRYISAKGTLTLTPLLQSYESKIRLLFVLSKKARLKRAGFGQMHGLSPTCYLGHLNKFHDIQVEVIKCSLVSLLFKNLTTPLSEFR